MIQIKGLNKQYTNSDQQPISILHDIGVEIPKGQFVSILGPSGCGKSTLLSIVAGLTQATSGEILISGQKVTKPGNDRGMVFQQAALFPWLNAMENVMFPLKNMMAKKEAWEHANRYLKMVQLSNYQEHYPHELSGGMQQRVAIARALAMDPEILLMDEPFGALDEQTRSRLHDQLENIWLENHKTILFVTHSISESIKLSDRVIVMGTKPGSIIQDITIDLPRPRQHYKQEMIAIEEKIIGFLKNEIDKVVREELADETYI